MRGTPNFVVPVEVSPDLEATVSTAFTLARQCGARVDILEVVPPRRASLLNADEAQLRNRHAHVSAHASSLAGAIASARRRGIDVRTVGYRGDAATIIPSYATLAKATLIVVDQHFGTARWRRSIRVVNDLARTAPVPVLVVPAPRPRNGTVPFRHILSAVDLTVASAVALRTVIDVSRRTGARLTLVHALTNTPDHMVFASGEALKIRKHVDARAAGVAERLRRKLPDTIRLRVDARVTTGAPHRAILNVATEVNADLIVMGVPPRSRLDEMVFGSTFRKVLRSTTIPLLAVPAAAGEHAWLEAPETVERPSILGTRRPRR